MGKSMYDFGNQVKEKARQQKQMEKASKRMIAKQHKAVEKRSVSNADPDINELGLSDEIKKP